MAKRPAKKDSSPTATSGKVPTYFVPPTSAPVEQESATTTRYYQRVVDVGNSVAPSVYAPARDGCMWYGDVPDDAPEPYRVISWSWGCPSCGVAPRSLHAWYCPRRTPRIVELDVWAEVPGFARQIYFGVSHPWDVETYYRIGEVIARNAAQRRTVELFQIYRDVYGWESPVERARNAAQARVAQYLSDDMTPAQRRLEGRLRASKEQRRFDEDGDEIPF